ncbi:MAG: hypothetical protein ACJZ4H_01780 [Candidatus Pelagibacter sp.]|tara:strand:+ start:390 stop:713 length:324 start_codon:yes stop_codon:yes gene_type:complete
MTPLTFSLASLVLVGVSGNFISFVRENKILSFISLLPSIYILVYGIYLLFGPVDIYEDGTNNFFLKNPEEKELPIVFILLKFYQYILIIVGSIFSYLFIKYLTKKKI